HLTATQGVQYVYQVTATDGDPGDTFTWLLQRAPAGMAISTSGRVTWTPSNAQVGRNAVTIAVRDVSGLVDTQSLTIEVSDVNENPSIPSAPPPPQVIVGTRFRYQIVGSDPDTGDTTHFTLSTAPSGMTITALGLIDWTPTLAQLGSAPVTVLVTDA